jgi:LmbE family N-acetylglucosaminyl deacetylase
MNILVLSAHPDDETIGAGGTIAKFASQGNYIHLLTFTDGISARKVGDRRPSVKDVAKILGISDYNTLNFPDNKMDSVPLLDVAKAIESISFTPDIVITHSPNDLNIDHRIVHQATLTVFRGMEQFNKTKIMCYEVLSSSEWSYQPFNPNCYVDITNYWDKKENALKVYESEMIPHPHPRNIENLKRKAYLNGSECGVEMAERFLIVREIL